MKEPRRVELHIHAFMLQCRDAGAMPAGVATLAGAAIYLGALRRLAVEQS